MQETFESINRQFMDGTMSIKDYSRKRRQLAAETMSQNVKQNGVPLTDAQIAERAKLLENTMSQMGIGAGLKTAILALFGSAFPFANPPCWAGDGGKWQPPTPSASN